MMSDVNDWKQNLSETEKNIIGSILKGFAQTETVVNDYWTNLVTSWFRKPEIIKMAVTFGAFETIHAEAYSLLNEELGLDNFSEFLEDEATMAKIQGLMDVRDSHTGEPDWHKRAKSLAIFSAFTEGVNLFSSFAILLSFKLRNLLKGVGQIVEWSIRDESLHSEAGCWLFRQLMLEKPELNTPELKEDIKQAALLSLKLELDFIDKVYEMGDLDGCSKYDLVSFIKIFNTISGVNFIVNLLSPSSSFALDHSAINVANPSFLIFSGCKHSQPFSLSLPHRSILLDKVNTSSHLC
jgi:ribonucleoside-diphosphate reductase beta chain